MTGLGRPFWLLYTGESTSAVGTAASLIALPVVALHINGDARQAGLVGTALSVGIVAARLPAGVIADRFDRRVLLLVSNLVGTLLLTALALLQARGAVPLPVLITTALLLGAVGSTLAPAESVAVRSFVPHEQLPRALALVQTRSAVAMVAGPLAGGALLAVDAGWVFLVDAATFLTAVICMALLPSGGRAAGSSQAPLRAAFEGLRFVWKSPFLRYAAVNATIVNLVFNGLLTVVIAAAGTTRHGSIDVGVQTAALGAGGLVGSLLAVPAARRLPPAQGVASATALIALALFGFATLHDVWAATLLLALAASAGPVITVVVATAQISVTPGDLQGRVHSGITFLAQAVSPLGPTLAGFSSHALGLTPTVMSASVLVGVLAVVGAVVIRHTTALTAHRDPAPEPLEVHRG
ncbi:MFS transporter [Streptomyces celluloflavus]|uniref:Multidrug efflux pump Tap n=1 Tax=Streptomyces celluloflavus TaxID=58344 RepID=A0ABW7RIS0_9ACTN|nr:MFS transporter [Streptomyces celluloflavus]